MQYFCLKQPIPSILSTVQLLKFLKNLNLLQTTVNMCKTGHNNMSFSTVGKITARKYLEAYLRYTDFA